MKTYIINSILPQGDVSNQNKYKKLASDFLHKTFNKAKMESLKKSEDELQIVKIENVPAMYTVSEVFFEERRIYSNKVPHGFEVSNASRIMSENDYDMWQIECPSEKRLFATENNQFIIADSTYITDCYTCGTSGDVQCTNCNYGKEACPNCNGNGGWNCNRCSGSGKMRCDYCGGSGTVNDTEQRYDSDGRPIYETRYVTCPRCNGYREVTCSQCNGGGWFNCNQCYSSGEITCRTCGGSTRIQCSSCIGLGHFLHSVNVDQLYDTNGIYNVQIFPVPENEIYAGKVFNELELNENDILICEYNDDVPITEIPIGQMIPGLGTLNLSNEVTYIEGERRKRGNARRHKKYRVRVYQRDYLKVEYIFQNRTYHLMFDAVTEECIMDINPYENVAEVMLEELKEHARELRFKSFLESYEEFDSITAFDNISYSSEDVKTYYKRLEYLCIAIPIFAGILAILIANIPIPGIKDALWPEFSLFKFILMIGSIAGGYGMSKLWKKIANDKKEITIALLAVPVFVGTLLLGFLLAQIG